MQFYMYSQLSGLSQATCADFGINFTLADSSYCSAHDYNTRSHECCECVSLAPPITSQPQTIELVRVSHHSFVVCFQRIFLVTVCRAFFFSGAGYVGMYPFHPWNAERKRTFGHADENMI